MQGGGEANFSAPHSVNAESEFKFHRRRSVVDLEAGFAGTGGSMLRRFRCWMQDALGASFDR